MAEHSRQRLGSVPGASGNGAAGSGGSSGGSRTTIEALPDACLCLVFEKAGTVHDLGFELYGGSPDMSPSERADWATAKHRLLQRVGPLVRSFEANELDPSQLGGSSGLQLHDYVHCLSNAALESVSYGCVEPATDEILAVLLRFPRLRTLYMRGADEWPSNATWVLRHLTRLQEFETNPSFIPANAPQALPSSLTYLQLHSDYPLPDCRPLERLTRLHRLELLEQESGPAGLLLPSATALPARREAEFGAARMQLPGAVLEEATAVAHPIGYGPGPGIAIKPAGTPRHSAASVHKLVLREGALGAVLAVLQTSSQPRVVELEVAGCVLSPGFWQHPSQLAHVTNLTVANCRLAEDPGGSLAEVLAQGLQHLSGLQKLVVEYCRLPQPPAALSILTGLRHLSLKLCEVDSMPSLSNLTGLLELKLQGTNLTALPELPHAPNLTALSMRNSRKLDLTAAEAQAMCQRLPRLTVFLVGEAPYWLAPGPARTAGLPSSLVEALVWLARIKPYLRIA